MDHLVDGVHLLDGLADGGEVGEHATGPALGHIRHVDLLCALRNDILGLFLGGNEQDLAACVGKLLHHIGCLVYLDDSLMQVDDVDPVFLHEDVRSHFGIPFPLQVTEVDTCIE